MARFGSGAGPRVGSKFSGIVTFDAPRGAGDVVAGAAAARAATGEASGVMAAGARVDAKFGGDGAFYPGVVEKANADGTLAILFDDGDKEPNARPANVRPLDGNGGAAAADAGVVARLEALCAAQQEELGAWRRGEKRAFACVDVTDDDSAAAATTSVVAAASAPPGGGDGTSNARLRREHENAQRLVRVKQECRRERDDACRRLECAVCCDRDAEVVFPTCSHLCMCAPCAASLDEAATADLPPLCPMCREPFLLAGAVHVKRA